VVIDTDYTDSCKSKWW